MEKPEGIESDRIQAAGCDKARTVKILGPQKRKVDRVNPCIAKSPLSSLKPERTPRRRKLQGLCGARVPSRTE